MKNMYQRNSNEAFENADKSELKNFDWSEWENR